MNPVAEVLTKAAGLIESKGWTQAAFARTPEGKTCGAASEDAACFCTVGALDATGAFYSVRAEAEEVLAEVVGWEENAENVKPWSFLVDWNDDPTRTKQQVLDALRDAVQAVGA